MRKDLNPHEWSVFKVTSQKGRFTFQQFSKILILIFRSLLRETEKNSKETSEKFQKSETNETQFQSF